MSKLFIIVIFLLKTQGFANELISPYQEPTSEQIKNQIENISNTFSQADTLIKNKVFNNRLKQERSILSQANEQSHPHQEPNNEQIKEQKENISKMFLKADELTKEKEFNQHLELERKNLSQIKVNGGVGYSFNTPQPISTGNDPNSPKDLSNNLNHDNSKADPPIVFVTLSMPTRELKLLIDECSKIGASIIIRGFYKDFKTTILKTKELSENRGISIDPTLFKKYQVTMVPTFILPLTDNQNSKQEFIKATGSVSLSYFLDLIIRTGSKEEILNAKSWRFRL